MLFQVYISPFKAGCFCFAYAGVQYKKNKQSCPIIRVFGKLRDDLLYIFKLKSLNIRLWFGGGFDAFARILVNDLPFICFSEDRG